MKTYLTVSLLIFSAFSCKKSVIDPKTQTYLTATINGTDWSANHEIKSYTFNNFIILGGENDSWVIGIDIPETATTGQTLKTKARCAKKMPIGLNIGYYAEENNLKITSKSATLLEGTFTFTAIDNNNAQLITITNGKFKSILAKL